uniref:UNC93-like protein MFSD11 isoform X2 n=1 Tax=Ciona intestinalis TaxID=7719 RepID=UPI000EF47F1B|nr:UNC93-like protein MFSD11 isoform X2 [Ciona intestinalis]|eukprot:XP_026693841.1 UNC93-like protein MFSD11 isoform X2 [Ciona intestinalis]
MELATLKFYNVIVLGFAFMLMFTGFQTCGMIEQTVLNSYKNETKVNGTVTYHGDGYTSLAIIYIVFAFANWLAPSVVSLLGAKYSMVFGGITYTLYLSSFIKPVTATLYIGSVLIGIGAAVLWTGQGAFLTMNSDEVTMGRNSGIFWAMLQCSLLIGNIYVFFAWQGVTTILDHQRIPLYIALTSVCALGTALLFILMRQPTQPPEVDDETTDENQVEVREKSPLKEAWEALLDSVRLFMTPNMMILSITFFYTGLELTFFSGVYTTAVGATKMFGEDSDKLVGLTGIMIGVGEILGGALFGIFGKKLTRYGRDPVVLLGGVVHLASFFLIFINIPDDAPIHGTHDQAYIYPNRSLWVKLDVNAVINRI